MSNLPNVLDKPESSNQNPSFFDHHRWWLAQVLVVAVSIPFAVALLDQRVHRFVSSVSSELWLVEFVYSLGFGMSWLGIFFSTWIILWALSLGFGWLAQDQHNSDSPSLPAFTRFSFTPFLADWAACLTIYRRRSAWVLLCFAATMATVLLLKITVGRPRPIRWEVFGEIWPVGWSPGQYDYASFPSGHAATYMALAVIVALHTSRWRWHWLALGMMCAFIRVWQGGHYLSDVLFGMYCAVVAPWLVTYVIIACGAAGGGGSILRWRRWSKSSPWGCVVEWNKPITPSP